MALGDDSHGTRLASGLSGGKIKRLHSCQKVNDTPTGRADSEIPRSLEPRIKAVKTRLSPVSERFVIGAPMLFRLELVNEGVDPIHYMDTGARYKPLLVQNEKKEPINYQPEHMQIRVQKEELAARSSVIVAERIGINAGKEIIRPGKYSVQFNSTEIALANQLLPRKWGVTAKHCLQACSILSSPPTNRLRT